MRVRRHINENVTMQPELDNSLHVFENCIIGPVEYTSRLSIRYVQRGRVDSKIGNQRLALSTGDLIMVPPDCKVWSHSPAEVNGISIFFNNPTQLWPQEPFLFQGIDKANFVKALFDFYMVTKNRNQISLKKYFDHLLDNSTIESKEAFQTIEDLAKKDIAHYYERLSLVKRKKISTCFDILQRVDSIRKDLEENCTQKFDLDALAKRSFMSKFSLIRNFREIYNLTPHQFYVQQKIQLAKKILTSGLTVREAAQVCGYPDIFSFSKQFKLVEGYSPSKLKTMAERPLNLYPTQYRPAC